MCRATTCKTCQRPTWAGCGAHVEQVLGHVPAPDRCRCREDAAAAKAAAKAAAPTGARRSLVDRLFGR